MIPDSVHNFSIRDNIRSRAAPQSIEPSVDRTIKAWCNVEKSPCPEGKLCVSTCRIIVSITSMRELRTTRHPLLQQRLHCVVGLPHLSKIASAHLQKCQDATQTLIASHRTKGLQKMYRAYQEDKTASIWSIKQPLQEQHDRCRGEYLHN